MTVPSLEPFAFGGDFQNLVADLSATVLGMPADAGDAPVHLALDRIGQHFGADRAYVFRYDFVAGTASNTHEWCAVGIEPQKDVLQEIPVTVIEDWVAPHREGRYLLIEDVDTLEDGAVKQILQPQGICSLIAYPMMQGEQCIGFVGLDSVRRQTHYGPTQAGLLDIFTRMLVGLILRRQSHEALLRYKDRLQAIFNTTRDAVWVVDVMGRLIEVNEAACAMLGYTRAELLSKSVPDIEAIQDADLVREHIAQVQKAGFARFESRHRSCNGQLLDVEVSVSLMRSEALLVSFIRDITEQKVLNAALLALASKMAGLAGGRFYTTVAEYIVTALGLDYAFVGRLRPGESMIELVAGWTADGPMQTFAYALAGTPCLQVMEKGYAIYPSDVQSCFPDDLPLVDMGVQSYIGSALYDKQGQAIGILVAMGRRAIHRPQLAERTLQVFVDRVAAEMLRMRAEERSRLFSKVYEHSGEAILICDHRNCIIDVNPAFSLMSGYALDEVRSRDPKMLASGQTPRESYQNLWSVLTATGHWQGELWNRRKDGSVYPKWVSISAIPDAAGATSHYVASFNDVSERKAAEERFDRLAHRDVLTGLLNRYSLEDRLEQALLTARRDGRQLALLFIDMDRFKTINDTLGHAVGDRLLQVVAFRLRSNVRESDIVARQGGDEFVVVLTHPDSPTAVVQVAEKLLRCLSEPYSLEEHLLHSTPSIGIAMYPGDADDVHSLLKNADAAMYAAKDSGRSQIRFFTAALMEAAQERMALESDLRVGVEQGQLELHYQPQVRARDGRVIGVEALVRWRHPERGLIPPTKFIPVAEASGLIEIIGAWVLQEACRQLAVWQAQGHDLRMAVNLSAHQLRTEAIVQLVTDCLNGHRLAAGSLELEVTESAMMERPELAIDLLNRLRAVGVRLAIDDFGTGYSSLAYLKRLPIQAIKLDRSFVQDIETDPNDAAISAATIGLAHTLGLEVVAEGVETPGQSRFLANIHGCDLLQGYLFGRPVPAEQVAF